jgi:hypothetical protein
MTAIAKNNAFGAGSPSWNLSFPDGNLTASEILAYLPHWLKSVDVILRLVNHGGRSVTMTHLLNKYRIMPTDDYQPNSTTVMINYAMRRAGKKDWTIGTRGEFENDREYDVNSLYVGDFRPPRLTHPKSASTKQKSKKEELARNWAADPIPFKDLALHIKEHPSGDDALDLTRCVEYALKHPKEKWLFPDDFGKLVKHIGGPLPVTHSHLDNQLFARYDHLYTAHAAARAPAKYNKKSRSKRKRKADTDSDDDADIDVNSETKVKSESEVEVKPKPKFKNTSRKARTKRTKCTKKIARQARDSVMTDWVDGSHDDGGGKRRSSRRVKRVPVYAEKDEDATVRSTPSSYPCIATDHLVRMSRLSTQTAPHSARTASSATSCQLPGTKRATSKSRKSRNQMMTSCLPLMRLQTSRTSVRPPSHVASASPPAKRARASKSRPLPSSWNSSMPPPLLQSLRIGPS